MATDSSTLIHPCPFSKGYGIPYRQAWLILKVFFVYRIILACLFVILFFSHFGPVLLGAHDTNLYIYSSLSYLILSIISGCTIYWKLASYTFHTQTLIFTDIVIITLIMHACGGVTSGMGLLLVVSTAAGGLLIGGRCAMLFAALASLAVLSEQIYAYQTHAFATSSYTYAGMLGASFFAIALLAYVLAQRTEQTELISSQHQQTISKLEELNRYIIQHLQSGIIIIDRNQQIKMSNEATLRLLGLNDTPETISDISSDLTLAFTQWLNEPGKNSAQLQLPLQTEINIRFTQLPTQHEVFYMITLEDIGLYNQRLQQSKLVSLGRLTASIAHEIRNPLGAISHASQLLSECPVLTPQDRRLTEIIQTHTDRVNLIIENILQLSRRNPSKREKIHLQSWLQDYLQKFKSEQGIAQAGQISLELGRKPLYIEIDPGHLRQILDNLCLNALKYGASKTGKIIIRVSTLQQEPCLEVIDSGPGVKPENLGRLFEPFFTTSSTGTGLGLYISRELAELNQAKLSYHLISHNKSCFRLFLMDAEQKMIEI